MSSSTSNMEEHFNTFVQSHPEATYEEWIGDMNPQAKEECLLEGLGGEILIDSQYYTKDSTHRQWWNEHLAGQRRQVPAADAIDEEADTDAANGVISDLLGGATSQATPPGSPSKETKTFPVDQDLLSFD